MISLNKKSAARGVSDKPRLLFVDHVFHTKTRSFDFLIDILKSSFDVHAVYVDPKTWVDISQLEDPAEYVVIAQMDFLTPAFIAAGKRVTVVQMYDGSAGLPDAHYQLNRQARYLNFSVSLHARALSQGAESHLVRYFTNPTSVKVVQDFSTLRGFFWQRLPKSGVNLNTVRRLVGSQLDCLHVHTPADDGSSFDPTALDGFECEVTTSNWFEKQSDFTELMDGCNVFIAPRQAEGIGHAFLEALARGMLVIAWDQPTHNEYISNWLNGVLFSDQVDQIQLERKSIEKLSANARLTMELGYQIWSKSHDSIVRFVSGAKPAQIPPIEGMSRTIQEIMNAYQQGIEAYSRALSVHPEFCRTLGSWNCLQAELNQRRQPEESTEGSCKAFFFFGYNSAESILANGWSDPEPSHLWAIQHEAGLMIPLDGGLRITSIELEARGLAQYPLRIFFNGIEIGEIMLEESFSSHQLRVPANVFDTDKGSLSVVLRVDEEVEIPNVESRPLSFAVKSMALSA